MIKKRKILIFKNNIIDNKIINNRCEICACVSVHVIYNKICKILEIVLNH